MFQRKMRRVRLVKNSRIDSQGDPSSLQFASSLIGSLSNDNDYETSLKSEFPRGGTQQILYGEAPRSNPLPFYMPFFMKEIPLSYTSINKWYCPLSHTPFKTVHPF